MFYLLIGAAFGFSLAWALRSGLDRRRNGKPGDVYPATSAGAAGSSQSIENAVNANEAAGDAIEGIQNLISSIRKRSSGTDNQG